jgi:nitrogen regulatory protein P-II 1
MKKIEAVIRPERLEVLRMHLQKIGYPGMMVTEIRGHGNQGGVTHSFRGNEFKTYFIAKVKVELVVRDEQVQKLLEAFTEVCRSGSVGDGKVFVSPVEDAYRIRTGEQGDKAI